MANKKEKRVAGIADDDFDIVSINLAKSPDLENNNMKAQKGPKMPGLSSEELDLGVSIPVKDGGFEQISSGR